MEDGEVWKGDPYYEFHHLADGESYLSYNFSKFKQYVYLPDIAGQTTEVIAKQLDDILETLTDQGYRAEIPQETWEVKSADGKTRTQPMDGWTPDIRVFTYHIKRIRDECRRYKNCVMLLDYEHPLRLTEEQLDASDTEQEEETEETEAKEMVPEIYYRHPIKGTVRVDNFALCTEINVIARSKNDSRAQHWYDLCWQMPDAPPRPQTKQS